MAAKQRTGAQEAFMRWALAAILAKPGHPLGFLVDPVTKDWHSRLGSRHRDAFRNEHFPAVQAGHLVSFHDLDDVANERLALQDADFNQEQNYSVETHGRRGIVISPAIEIGGVPVELRTARMWENVGVLAPKGTVAKAKPHQGWALSG
jgi:putative RNase toxin 5 of polymorphic toxin system